MTPFLHFHLQRSTTLIAQPASGAWPCTQDFKGSHHTHPGRKQRLGRCFLVALAFFPCLLAHAQSGTPGSGGNLSSENQSASPNGSAADASPVSGFKKISLAGVGKQLSYGDSYVSGGEWAASPDRFTDVFAKANNLAETNRGFGGTGIYTAAINFNNDVNTALDNSDTCIVLHAGVNTMRREGESGKAYAEITNSLRSFLTNTIIGAGVGASAFSEKKGDWETVYTFQLGGKGGSSGSNFASGAKNNVSGSFIEHSIEGTAIVVSYLNTCLPFAAPGSFDVYVDGILKKSVVCDAVDAVALPGDGEDVMPGAVLIDQLAAGKHSVKIVNTSNHYVFIDYAASVKDSGWMPTFVMLISRMPEPSYRPGDWLGTNDAQIAKANDAIRRVVATEFSAYPITCVDSNRTWDLTTDMYKDQVHRNATGNKKLAEEMQQWVTH